MLLVPGCFKWCEFNATHSSEGLHELRSQLCGQCGNRNYEQLESSRAEGIKKNRGGVPLSQGTYPHPNWNSTVREPEMNLGLCWGLRESQAGQGKALAYLLYSVSRICPYRILVPRDLENCSLQGSAW